MYTILIGIIEPLTGLSNIQSFVISNYSPGMLEIVVSKNLCLGDNDSHFMLQQHDAMVQDNINSIPKVGTGH